MVEIMASTFDKKKASLPPAVATHYYLHHKSMKIATGQFKLAIAAAIFFVIIDIFIALTKERLATVMKGKAGYEDWQNFFELKEWVQWTILGIITGWCFVEIGLAALLRYACQNEARPHLQVWITLYCVDMLLSVALMVTLFFVVVLSTKIFLGIIGVVFYVMEVYYFSILYRYSKSLKTTARFDVCQTEDDKLSIT